MISLMVFDENKGFEVESLLRVGLVTKNSARCEAQVITSYTHTYIHAHCDTHAHT
jgi:hypothetical protein